MKKEDLSKEEIKFTKKDVFMATAGIAVTGAVFSLATIFFAEATAWDDTARATCTDGEKVVYDNFGKVRYKSDTARSYIFDYDTDIFREDVYCDFKDGAKKPKGFEPVGPRVFRWKNFIPVL